VALLVAHTSFFSGCQTVPVGPVVKLAKINPARPELPAAEKPAFVDKDGGLWLSSDDYRKLERNIINLREYIGKLEALITYYESEGD
jgi:hypothetical protein